MVHIKGLEGTFDTVVSKYEKMRPGYAPELYQTIFDYAPIGEDSRVVEVGSGSGQATLPVLQKGCELVSVEYGENFSKALREKFKDYPKFSVITGKFEDAELPKDSFDLVYSATAFHWVRKRSDTEKYLRYLRTGAFSRASQTVLTHARTSLNWRQRSTLIMSNTITSSIRKRANRGSNLPRIRL